VTETATVTETDEAVVTETPAPKGANAELTQAVASYTAAHDEVRDGLVERGTEVSLTFQCLLASVHPLFIGERGVAKSMMTDALISHIGDDISSFERLLAKDTPAEEVLGPPNLAALKAGKWERVTEGKLPRAHLAFLDEIFKANSTVLNALLKIINERIFYNNGGAIRVPLMMLVGASNELPGHDRDDLAAFRDRFGICKIVKPVRTDDGVVDVLDGQLDRLHSGTRLPAAHTMISLDQIELLQQAVRQVTVPDAVKKDYVELRRRAEAEGLSPSLRRMFEGLKVAMAAAVMRGDTALSSDDLTVMEHVLWTDPDDHKVAYELVLEYAGQAARKAVKLRSEYEPILTELNDLKPQRPENGEVSSELAGKFARVNMLLKSLKERVRTAVDEGKSDNRDTTALEELLGEVEEQQDYVRNEVLGFGM
jgi:MoxR-like ATPase